MMRILIGVDDTNNPGSRGTGSCVRRMAAALEEAGLAGPEGITRHQLLESPRIPHTGHNSCICLVASCEEGQVQAVWDFCADFLKRESADGSNAGLCLAEWGAASKEVRAFAQRAKREVLTETELGVVVRRSGLRLAGLTGSGLGRIGAMAAVGLRASGNDGRFTWLPGLRELKGTYRVEQLRSLAHIDEASTPEGTLLPPEAQVDVGDWVRPVLRNGQAILLVERHAEGEWRMLAKETVKERSG